MIPPTLSLDDRDPVRTIREAKEVRQISKVWNVVLFHAEWNAKSRELEIVTSLLSNQLSLLPSNSFEVAFTFAWAQFSRLESY